MHPPLYILAGGKSSRFGSDKARALLRGQPLISRIALALAPVVNTITVVADQPDKYRDLHLTTITDPVQHRGPLTGLATALAHHHTHGATSRWLLLCACDLARVEPAWVHALLAHANPPAHAVAYRHTHWEPLFALYHSGALETVHHQLTTTNQSMQHLLNTLDATALPLPKDWPTTPQINTPNDHHRASEEQGPPPSSND